MASVDTDGPRPPFTYQVLVEQGKFPIGTVDVSDDGELMCLKCRLANCEHIKGVLELNLDVNIFYLDSVMVPMDLRHNVFVKFILSSPPIAGSRSIRLHPDEGDVSRVAGSLGLLSMGETRKVLRSILLDWLRFYTASQTRNMCVAKTHGYREQVELDKHMDEKQSIMPYLETWSLLRNEACLSCMEYRSDDDDYGLIPSTPMKPGGMVPRPGSTSAGKRTPPGRARRVPLGKVTPPDPEEDDVPF
jgi:hypothetical protein